VQALELAVLRAFDSTSEAIDVVADSVPVPVRRASNAKASGKEAVTSALISAKESTMFASELSAAAFSSSTLMALSSSPSSPLSSSSAAAAAAPAAPSSSSSLPHPGTLRVKLHSFAPYAALFKASSHITSRSNNTNQFPLSNPALKLESGQRHPIISSIIQHRLQRLRLRCGAGALRCTLESRLHVRLRFGSQLAAWLFVIFTHSSFSMIHLFSMFGFFVILIVHLPPSLF
jgi:hypothetical protein